MLHMCPFLQVAPTSMRGTLGSLNQLMICLGILAALVVNVALPVAAWRTMFMLAVAPAALLFLGGYIVSGDCWCWCWWRSSGSTLVASFVAVQGYVCGGNAADHVHAGRGASGTAVPMWVATSSMATLVRALARP